MANHKNKLSAEARIRNRNELTLTFSLNELLSDPRVEKYIRAAKASAFRAQRSAPDSAIQRAIISYQSAVYLHSIFKIPLHLAPTIFAAIQLNGSVMAVKYKFTEKQILNLCRHLGPTELKAHLKFMRQTGYIKGTGTNLKITNLTIDLAAAAAQSAAEFLKSTKIESF